MEQQFKWTEEGLQLYAELLKFIEESGGYRIVCDQLEYEWLSDYKKDKMNFVRNTGDYSMWSKHHVNDLIRMYNSGKAIREISRTLKRTFGSVNQKLYTLRQDNIIKSRYAKDHH